MEAVVLASELEEEPFWKGRSLWMSIEEVAEGQFCEKRGV